MFTVLLTFPCHRYKELTEITVFMFKLAKMRANNKKEVRITPEFLAGRGYSVNRAAMAAGVSATHLCLVLKGERKPSAELVRALKALPAYHPVKCRVNY